MCHILGRLSSGETLHAGKVIVATGMDYMGDIAEQRELNIATCEKMVQHIARNVSSLHHSKIHLLPRPRSRHSRTYLDCD
jgi:hypothetical protein